MMTLQRTLFVGLTLVLITGCHQDLHPDDRQVGVELRNAGAVLGLDHDGRILDVRLSFSNADDSTLKLLARVPHLRGLYLERTFVTDEGLATLGGLPNLVELNLLGTDITSKSLESISKIRTLQTLRLDQTQISDHQLDRLQSLPHLDCLWLCNTLVTDRSVPLLASLKLNELALVGTRVSSLGLQQLKQQSIQTVVIQ